MIGCGISSAGLPWVESNLVLDDRGERCTGSSIHSCISLVFSVCHHCAGKIDNKGLLLERHDAVK
jgi:hypothetical protein